LVGTIPWRYRLELRQLRYFVAVARERNFTRAAEALGIAQPPLSRQIQQLEDELGVTLIERGSRPVRLTDGGRLLYEQAVQVLERVERLRRSSGVCRKPAAGASASGSSLQRSTAICPR
jgi:LysR family transcriptional regulator, benzoate and cis,cis-muconate-responsive activator of ben and cat genes